MSPVEALKIALKKEEGSIKVYEKLVLEHPSLKDLLYSLITEEQKHKRQIEEKIRELTHY